MAKEKAKSAVVVTPKVAKITKSDITNAILAQSIETKVDLLSVTAIPSNLEKFTKDDLISIVKVANPKFEVLKKTTKGEIIPAIIKAEEKNFAAMVDVVFTEATLMKLTKDVLEAIVAAIKVPSTETEETAATPTDATILVENVEVIAEQTEAEQTEA